jgi:hypothetical protein
VIGVPPLTFERESYESSFGAAMTHVKCADQSLLDPGWLGPAAQSIN